MESVSVNATILSFEECETLWRTDDMAARAVEVWPKAMLSVPFYATCATNKDAELKINDKLKALGFTAALKKAIQWQRAFGGAAILIGANDSQGSLAVPLVTKAVKSVDWLNVLHARQLQPFTYYTNPAEPKFGQVATYRVVTGLMHTAVGAQENKGAQALTGNEVIHETRLIIFDGVRTLDGTEFKSLTGWGDSVLNRMYKALRGFGITWDAAYHLMTDNSQGIYKMKGLVEMLQAGSGVETLMAKRMRAIDMSRSVMRSIIVDSDAEDFTRITTPMTGVAEMLDRVGRRLSAAADMPYVILLGESPGGLGSNGNAEITAFYDRVDAMRAELLGPAILQLAGIVAVLLKCNEPLDTEFEPLSTPTQLEQAQGRNIQAQTDAIYITNGVVSPDEIAASRFGAGGYDFNTTLDTGAR